MIERPSLIYLIKAQTWRLDSTSSPEVGSSRMMSFEPPTKAMARDNFLFIPPERVLAILSLCSLSMTMSKILEIS